MIRLVPWWLQPLVIVLLVVVLLGQRVQVSNAKARVTAAEKDLIAYQLAASETARLAQADADRKALDQLNRQKEAADAATTREAALRADAAAAGAERDRLLAAVRKAIPARGDPVPSAPAGPDYQPGSALIELFGACTAEVQDLARLADGHASDVRTLIDSWPR